MFVYTVTLLVSPMPLMPFVPGSEEWARAMLPSGALLAAGSWYAASGEWREKYRPLVGTKILIASSMTLVLAVGTIVGAAIWLATT